MSCSQYHLAVAVGQTLPIVNFRFQTILVVDYIQSAIENRRNLDPPATAVV
jgi:hypothetical protein